VGEWVGVLIAIVSSALGGTAAAVTRYLVADADPLTLLSGFWRPSQPDFRPLRREHGAAS